MNWSRKITCAAILLPCLFVSIPASAKSDRLAVVIANGNYTNIGALRNPVSDGRLVAESFRASGFEVLLYEDLGEQQVRNASRDIAKKSGGYDVTLVYYAGHGVQISGINYLLPVDLTPPEVEDDIKLTSISADDLLAAIKSPYKVVVLDACRDNPVVTRGLSRGRSISMNRGLAPPGSPELQTGGVFIAYSTQADAVAIDGDGQYSPFAESFSRYVGRNVSIDDMFALVTRDVLRYTKGQQRPFKYASLDSIFCLPGDCNSPDKAVAALPASASSTEVSTPAASRGSFNLSDAFKKLEALAPNSLESKKLESELRSQRDAQFGPVVLYGDFVGKTGDVPVPWGFLPATVERVHSGYSVDVQVGSWKEKKVEWNSGFQRYSIFCNDHTYEQTVQQAGEATIYLSKSERQRLVANEGSIAESLLNVLCEPIISTTPIATVEQGKWIPIGTLGRVAGDTVTMAASAIRTARDNPSTKYIQYKSEKVVLPDSGEIPGVQGFGIARIDCKEKKFGVIAAYQIRDEKIDAAFANSMKMESINPGSVPHNAYVLSCESGATVAD